MCPTYVNCKEVLLLKENAKPHVVELTKEKVMRLSMNDYPKEFNYVGSTIYYEDGFILRYRPESEILS